MIFTSYFAKASKIPDAIKISIALSKPDFFRTDATIPVFVPTYEILKEYKQTGDTKAYTDKYIKLLEKKKRF